MAKFSEIDVDEIAKKPKYSEISPDKFQESQKPIFGDDPYRLKEAKTLAKIAGKGVPILGNFIDNDEAMQRYSEENPKTAKGLQIAGGVGSMLIPGMAIGRLGSLGYQVVAGAGLGGMLGVGNNYTNPDPNKPSMSSEAGWGALFGGLGPVGSKLLSPKQPLPPMSEGIKLDSIKLPPGRVVQGFPDLNRFSAEGKKQLASLEKNFHKQKASAEIEKNMPHWLNNDANIRRLSGAALGASGMMSFGPMGLAAGAIPYIPAATRGAYRTAMKMPNASWANKGIKGSDITTNDIIRALALQKDNSKPSE